MPRPKKKMASPPSTPSTPKGERLQRVLAAAGLGSRRQCEELILEGRVEIDRKTIVELGTRVDTDTQKIRVDGEALTLGRRVYYAVNKPAGVVSTSRDPSGRLRVIDLVDQNQRTYCVGRLDKSSEGLIIVTNDGDLANQLTHPRYGVEKTYHVSVVGRPTADDLRQMQKGVYLSEGKARVVGVKIKKRQKGGTLLEMVLAEGRNREIRRVMARFGHKVLRLTRVAIGPLRLGSLPVGHSRPLEKSEIRALKRAAEAGRSNPKAPKKAPKRRTGTSSSSRPTQGKASKRSAQGTRSASGTKQGGKNRGGAPAKKKASSGSARPSKKLTKKKPSGRPARRGKKK